MNWMEKMAQGCNEQAAILGRMRRIENGESPEDVYGDDLHCFETEMQIFISAMFHWCEITPPSEGREDRKPFSLNASEHWIREMAEAETGHDIAAGGAALIRLAEERETKLARLTASEKRLADELRQIAEAVFNNEPISAAWATAALAARDGNST